MMTITCLIGVRVLRSFRPLTSPALASTVTAESELAVGSCGPGAPLLQAAETAVPDAANKHSDVRMRMVKISLTTSIAKFDESIRMRATSAELCVRERA
jgi:hypothetical protein